MATMILSAAGASLGGAAGGSLLGIGATTFGRAAGSIAGGLIDQKLLGRGGAPVEVGRSEGLRLQGAGEGAAIPNVYGRMRVGGQMIWSSRFNEQVDESTQGGKGGGPKVREYSYTISFAVALCAGEIRRIGRVWADGNEISLSDYAYRLHRGEADQAPDALIEAIEGEAPAFKDIAYVVFEEMPLSAFGNRVPQLNFEVYREPPANDGGAERLSDIVQAVALSPGSGEFALDTLKTRRVIGPGRTTYENVNTADDEPDIVLGLDQLSSEAPNCDAVSLIVSWFGDDLRCGACEIRPCVETEDKETDPSSWTVSGVGRNGARSVSKDADGRPVFGGTPSDGSVIRAIQEMNRRGLKVLFYPFILMDVPADNQKPNPWTGEVGQPAFPWRGRITLNRAPGVAGSTDKTSAAGDEVEGIFGQAAPGDFVQGSSTVEFNGPEEWTLRRFVLHYAHLCAAAGGVDGFCIGSEMRSLTQIRDGADSYPAVEAMRALAADVRSILGPDVKVGYAADWSEYFGHQPGDGTGDVFFHLDPLWADPAIDFIGIDNYLPLSDWRYSEGHLDETAKSPYAESYLKGNVAGGEGYDWFYADSAARDGQLRTPIVDGAYGEDWVFRPKDITNWWSNPHYDRPGGVRSATPTSWTPGSKPVWFTEIGCPAVDLGANQPNVFVDPKSSETSLPYFSRGVRDDYMQRCYLQAAIGYWRDEANNPISPSYGGPMVATDRIFIWTWDVRPWPDFPYRRSIWSDGDNHRLGHWITGRLGAAPLADVVAEICRRAEVPAFDVSELRGVVQGYASEDAQTGRAALQPLMMAYGFDAFESGGALRFRHRDGPLAAVLAHDDVILTDSGAPGVDFSRAPQGDEAAALRYGFVDEDRGYESGALEARAPNAGGATRIESVSAPLLLDSGSAQSIADRHLAEARVGREGANFSAAPRLLALEPGDIVAIEGAAAGARYRIDRIEDRGIKELSLSRIEPQIYASVPSPVRRVEPAVPAIAAPVAYAFLDLPLLPDDDAGLKIAAAAEPWTSAAGLFVSDDGEAFAEAARIPRPAVMGALAIDLPRAEPHIWTRDQFLDVSLVRGGLSAKSDLAVLNGDNRAAIRSPSGEWEIIQFQSAELIAPDYWRLSRLLRGQAGTEALIGDPTPAGASFVLLNDAVATFSQADDLRGAERRWRVGPTRKPVSHDSYVAFEATDAAARLRPYAPARLRAARNGDAIQLSWIRRARFGGDSWIGAAPPLGEAREVYLVRLSTGREVEVSSENWIYDAAMQAEDGAVGSIEAAVSQISDQYGPGPETKVVFNV